MGTGNDGDASLSVLNPHPVKLPGPSLLHHLVRSASEAPALDALDGGTRTTYTYQQLHNAAEVIARRLTQAHPGREAEFVVPVLVPQSPLLYAALLGTLKAGGAFCPLNIDAPSERVQFILDDVDASVVVVSRELADKLPPDCSQDIIIIGFEHNEPPKTNLIHRQAYTEDLAYVMYTSGSTGTPKGVGITHEAATQALLSHDRHIPTFSRFLQFAAPTFDVSVFEIFFPLFRGCTLVTVQRADLLNDLPSAMRDMEVDACELTPTVAGSLLRSRDRVPSLKLVLTIGEMLSQPVIREFGGDEFRASMLWAMYGPTEATIHCTLKTSMSSSSSVGNIGAPLDTVSCFVIKPTQENQDPQQVEFLPRGESGELAVGGFQLAREYLNRPEQTAAAFVSSPYGRLYRTGDGARVLPDGTLECLGRLGAGQVKLRGQRIELGEIEQAILRTKDCVGAFATVESSVLVAFCAVEPGVSEQAILDTCSRWLPQFMLPGELVLLKTFPKLPSGKVDRRKLLDSFRERKTGESKHEDNSSQLGELQQSIISIVSSVLDSPVDIHTRLGSSGLDSLSAIRLASSLRSAGYATSASKLMSSRTVSGLLSSLEQRSEVNLPIQRFEDVSLLSYWDAIATEVPEILALRDEVEDIIRCSPLQKAMLAESGRHPTMYWNMVELDVDGDAAPQQVANALRIVARNNEILRSGFVPQRDGFMSLVFKGLESSQIRVVREFDYDLCERRYLHILHPLDVQIRAATPEQPLKILIHIHHAIYDGWSFDMLVSDLSDAMSGRAVVSRPQFRDFSAFSLHTPAREQADIAKAFWTDHLLGWNKVPFPLLTDVKEPHKQPLCTVDFLSLQRDEVSTASERLGCSTQVIFQASLAIVWSGILGASDIVLGTVTSGRTAPVDGVETLMGPCIAALPLRIDFGRVTENVHLINQIQASNREMMEHSTLPTSDIRHAASIQPGESLYDVLFVYQESPESRRNTGCPIRQSRHMDHLETKVLVEVEPLDNGFGVQVTYHPDAVRSDMVQDILEQFKAAVVHVLKYPNDHVQSIRHAPVSGISVYNETPTTFSGVPDLATSFEATARGQPSSDAICFSSGNWQDKTSLKTITYNELNILGNRVAHYLQSEGIASNQVVGVVMEKSIDLYAAILGVVKAGCAYLPLLPSTPASRVQEILQQAEVMYCLIDSSALPAIESIRDVCFLDFHSAPFHAMPDSNPRIPADGSRLAYVIYTSGTTGKPKGVAVSQKNIVANIDHLRSMYPQSSVGQSRLLQACSQAFDVSVFEIFFSWHTGMCLCAGSNDTLFDNFERAIRELHITHLSLTPTVASLVNPKNVPEVMFLVTAGEPMTKSVLERWGELLWQGYGPSETTNICSVKPMQREMPIEHLGWVFPNTSVFVLFPKSCDVVPRGWVGEFCYGGDQVAVGYLNSPRITAESFINHPRFGRLYRSGDMGRMLPDGSLVILGRIDTQLKLRGQRIEAGEVNSTITTSGIATTAITMLATRKGQDNDQLVSFYVPSSKGSLNTLLDVDAKENRTLFSTLQARLPSYMVPTHLIPISNVPQTKSGKVDLRRLKSWYSEASQSYIESTALSFKEAYDYGDWTEVERLVADAMAEELQVASNMIDQWTPFVTLGVDSVSAISLARGLSKRLKRKIPVSAIIRNPNVVQLSRYVCSDFATNKTVDSATMVPAEVVERTTLDFIAESMAVEAVLPCTPLQEAMLSGGQNSYINRIMLRLQISADEMRGYWAEMSRRHEILRTCFAATTDTKRAIVQVVLSNWQIPWTTFEVTTPSFDDVVHDHMSRLPNPVDSKSPPVSLAAINYKGSVFLSFICHHALYDGVAMENLWKEVEALANGRSLPPAISYEPFLREVINLPSDYEDFWREQFRDFRTTSLFPKSIGRKLDQATSASSLAIPLAELHHRAQSLGISLLSLCQAAWVNTLSIVYGTSDVCFGNVVSGRTVDVDGIDRLVAPCFNTVPIRKDVASNRHGIETVKYFHQLNSRLLPYQFTPLRYVQKIANARRGLFETLLLLQKPLQEMDDSVWILEEDAGDMDVPLVCEVVPCPSLNTLIINMQYDMNAVSSDIAATLSGIFRHFMEKILETPYATIADKESIPETLREGLEGLKPRQEKPERTGSPDSHSEQWSLVEEQVRQILTQLSGRADSTITRHTTIFQLGLDSINAVQVASLLRRRGINATVSDVMECPTCAKLADRVQRNPSNFGVKQRPAYDFDAFSRLVESQVRDKLPPDSTPEAILPCTPMQAGMLTAFKQSDGRSYLNSMEYVVDVAVSTDNLTRAIEILRDQHPMLRTCFIPINHNDSAFAMVRYPAGSSILPKISVNYENASGTAQEEILHNLRRCLLENPHIPPWQVVLNYDEALTMTLVIHHALYDAQTLQNILNQLNEIIYGNAQISIPPVEGGLAAIIHEAHGNENKDLAKTFWEDQAKSVVVNSFPTMTPLRVTGDSLLTWSMLSNSGLALIQEAIQKTGVSIQAVVQAAWARVLSSYLGESKIVFGVSLSGRDSDETRDSPFPCLTTVPVIAENKSSNLELLRLMMNLNAQVRKHQYAPLNQIQKWLGHPGSSVFDTLVSYRKLEHTDVGSNCFHLREDNAAVEFPVSIEIEQLQNEIKLGITYQPAVIPTEQAKMLLRQFDATMIHLALHPHGSQDDFDNSSRDLFSVLPPIIPEIEAPVQLLHQFVEERALTHPNDIALEFVDSIRGEREIDRRRWTYREFDEMGNRVAHMLSGKAPIGSIVAVHFDKCPEAYFSILGILKSGSSFVALDPSAPMARKEFILKDSAAPCVLTAQNSSLDTKTKATVIQVTTNLLNDYPSHRRVLDTECTSDATCYCLYTSGTTGTPKGCEITHENTVQAMMAFQNLFRDHWDTDSRWLQFASLHFDVSVLEQYWSWSVGITVVAASKDLILDDLTGTINALGITHIDLTPSLARLTSPEDCPTLCKGVFITGGESLKQEILDTWGPQAVIYNAYGPTEATIGVTMYQRVPVNGRPSNIGKQFLNVGSYVFKPGTEIPVLKGAVGELCVSGKLVGKGYLGRRELTLERFPVLQEFGEKIYRTGDLVRLLHDGCFDFLGRADDQIKLRGQRLEIGEINHAIRSSVTDIVDVATIVAAHSSTGKDVLVTFFVPNIVQNKTRELVALDDTIGLGSKAREACRARLPGYMVPTYFLPLPYIPLSANNKAEARELKKVFENLTYEQLTGLTGIAQGSRSATANRMTTIIIDALLELNGEDKIVISPSHSVFDAGIDSISALRLSLILRERGVEAASPATILRNPVIADLAEVLSKEPISTENQRATVREAKQRVFACNQRWRGFICRELSITPADIEYIAPCSPLQQGIISKSVTNGGEQYFNSFRIEMKSNLASEKIIEAWNQLISAESILRTMFVGTSEGYLQVALKRKTSPWKIKNVDRAEDIGQIQHVTRQDWIQTNSTHIVNPLQLVLINIHEKTQVLVHIFHGIYDGNSLELMLQRVAINLQKNQLQESPKFAEALVHGPLWQYDDCQPFWVDHLRGWMARQIPSKSSEDTHAPASAARSIAYNQLESVRKSQNVTMQSLLLALWSATLGSYYGEGHTIGVIVSGRSIDLPGADQVVGPLFNTLPFFNKSLNEHTWSSLVQKCQDFSTSILPFQHTPLQNIQKWCSKGRPLFDNLFAFQIEDSEDVSGHDLWTIHEDVLNADYRLAFEVKYVKNAELQITIVAQGHIADSRILRSLLDQLEDNLKKISYDASQMIAFPPSDNRDEASRAPYMSEITDEDDDVATSDWNPEAQVIRDEVARISSVPADKIRASTSILELGLDSIDVIKLSATLRRCGVEIPASLIMRLQTVSKMANAVKPVVNTSPNVSQSRQDLQSTQEQIWRQVKDSGLQEEDIESVLPATALQESMVMGMLESHYEWYFNHDVLELEAGTDLDRLLCAWDEVVRALPILRTGFLELGEMGLDLTYCQIIFKAEKPVVLKMKVGAFNEIGEVIQQAKLQAREGKGLRNLLQLTVVEVGDRQLLVLSMAHALYDGWSLGLIFRQLDNAYQGKPLEYSFSKEAFENLMERPRHSTSQFWSDYLHDSPPTFMTGTGLTNSSGNLGVHRAENESPITLSELTEFCKVHSISLQVLCLACWAVVLSQNTKQLDVAFGVVLSGRDFQGAENLMFPTMNTVTVRCILHGSVSALLRYLEDTMGDIREFQNFPLRKAQLAAGARPGGLFDTLFMLQKSPNQDKQRPLFKSIDGASAVDYPVCVEAESINDHLVWRIACQAQSYTEEETTALLDMLHQTLSFFIAQPSSEVLSFHGSRVSICGLGAIEIQGESAAHDSTQKDDRVDQPWDDTSLAIRDVLSQVSGITANEIPLSSNIYVLGLDSITAIKASSLLRRRSINLGPRDLARATTISDMVAMLSVDEDTQTHAPELSDWRPPAEMHLDEVLRSHDIDLTTVEDIYPATPMQVYMVGAWQLSGGSVFYATHSYLFHHDCEIGTIHAAWREVVRTNAILRTQLVSTLSKDIPLVQVILKEGYDSDRSTVSPMVRLVATWNEERRGWMLNLKIHHALYDGVSLPAILEQFRHYAFAINVKFEESRVKRELSLWKHHCTLPTLEANRISRRQFWENYLLGCDQKLPGDGLARPDQSNERASYLRRSALADTTELRRAANKHGVSVQSIFLAAYAQIIAASQVQDEASKQQVIVMGLYLANRSHGRGEAEVPSTYPSLSLVPLKVVIRKGLSLLHVASEVHKDIIKISSEGYVDVGLWEIATWTGVKISTFVNFLSLPDGGEDRNSDENAKSQIEPVGEVPQSNDGRSQEDELSGVKPIVVRDDFLPSIDVEVALQDGALTIGVFGPRQMLADNSSEEVLVSQIVEALSNGVRS